ncbi:MAG: Crp/Fnr family transcriptional regulator [Clostridia bacterium]|nr:Crp/Fnr family transcriptional regulator [Clostridia bacterium]
MRSCADTTDKVNMNEVWQALRCCALFRNMDISEISNAVSSAGFQIREFEKGEFICREDQFSDQVGVVISGGAEVQKSLPSGNLYCLFYENIGDMFGGCVAFSSKTSYPCDIYSSKNSSILFFQKMSFYKLFENPKITENMMSVVSQRILSFESRLELFSYSSIQKKIAFYLINEIKATDNRTVVLPFSKKQWAEYLNVSRPSLCRELKKLSCCKAIEIEKNKITVLDKNYLTAMF